MQNGRLLYVEDEPLWIELVSAWLERAGYSNFKTAGTGREALELAVQEPPKCLLLDLVLPDQSGLELCQKLRALPNLSRAPIILFTAHKREKVLGLQNGADYFVAKAERPDELLATLDAAFRRQEMAEGLLTKGNVILNKEHRQVFWKGKLAATLTLKPFTLLYVLVERSPQPVSRADLYRLVEGIEETPLSRALDVLLNRLRQALPEEVSRYIMSVKGFGYAYLEPYDPSGASPRPVV